jgi:adenylate cyclase
MKKLSFLIFRRTWSFKVNILTLFIALISIAFACVIAFTYPKEYSSDLSFSKGVAERASQLVLDRMDGVVKSSEHITEVAAHYFLKLGDLSIEDPRLTSFLLNVLKGNDHFASCYLGLSNGIFIEGANQFFSRNKTFVSDPSRPLPEAAAYSLIQSDTNAHPPTGLSIYLDKNFKEIDREVYPIPHYEMETRPWYEGAMKTKGLFWTGFYEFLVTGERGISVGYPMLGPGGEIIGVAGADLTLLLLSNFLRDQTIGKTGKAFILDSLGEILVPFIVPGKEKDQKISSPIVSEVFRQYLGDHQNRSDFIVSHGDEKFLAYVSNMPASIKEDWRIVIIAPLDDFFGETFQMQKEVFVIVAAILIITAILIGFYARRISTPIVTLAQEVDKIGRLDLKSDVRVKSNIKEIFLIDNAIASLRHAVSSFAKYVPKEIVRGLFQKNEEISLGGEKRELTLFFSDISGFSAIAESYSIDVLTPLVSEYFQAMSRIILESGGTIDKFLGDGIMAFWGAPLPIDDHPARACTAALLCKEMLSGLNQKRKAEGQPEFPTRFGIHTGMVIVGNIGTQERMNYTVIGDAVNLTSRLQGVDKLYRTSILISEDVHKQLSAQFVTRPVDIVTVKGKMEKIKIYELVGKSGAEKEIEATEDQILLCRLFSEAYEAVQAGDLKRAQALLTSLAEKFPDDYPTQLYIKRIEEKLR